MSNKKIGRPTKYSPELLAKTLKYITESVPENMTIPTIEGLSILLDVDDDQINNWTKIYPEFHAAIKRLKASQKQGLMITGLFGGKEINPTMAIFLLKVNHGMIETERQMLVGKDGDKLEISIVEEKQTTEDE